MRQFFVVALVLSFAGAASALTLKEKQKQEFWTKELSKAERFEVKSFKEKCGYDLPITFEESMVTPFMAENRSLSSYCEAPRNVMRKMCEDATAKAEITKKVKKVSCKLGKAEDKDPVMSLANGELTFTVGTKATNIDDKTKKWLENNL